jgi:hypothetical protein
MAHHVVRVDSERSPGEGCCGLGRLGRRGRGRGRLGRRGRGRLGRRGRGRQGGCYWGQEPFLLSLCAI